MTRTIPRIVRADQLQVGDVFLHARHKARCTVTAIRIRDRHVAISYEMPTLTGNIFRATRIAACAALFDVEA